MEKLTMMLRCPDVEDGRMDGASSSKRRLEHGPQNKKQRCMGNGRATLYDLCLQRAAFILPQVAHKLRDLPDEYALPVLREFLRRVPGPSMKELRKFCTRVDWVPQHLSLYEKPYLSTMRAPQAELMLPNLVRVDLRECEWLENLDFLSALKRLECLNLGDCQRIAAGELRHVRELPRLECLDVENIPAVDDAFGWTILGLTGLRALNVSFTSVSDHLVEVLTYGNRLRADLGSQQAAGSGSNEVQTLLSQYPSSNLTYFRFQGTQITDASIAHLQAISDLQLLDVRQAKNMTGRSFTSLKAKHKLIALPNWRFLAARTNAMLAGVLRGECGCRSMAPQDEFTDEFTKLCQQAFSLLLHKPGFEWHKFNPYGYHPPIL